MTYAAFKHLHLMVVAITAILFVIRAGGLMAGMQWVGKPVIRVVHHCVDLLILLSALGLCYHLSQWPFYNSAWISAKFIGLIAYMVLTALAMRRHSLPGLALAAVFLAYTAWVAINKVPFPSF